MRNFIAGIAAAVAVAVVAAAIIWTIVLPRLDWGATQSPSPIETRLAQNILKRWIARNAGSAANPVPSNPQTLKTAQSEFGEHCALCHALDGSGRNQLEADFAPPVAKLTGTVQQFSDAELYFIITHGVRNTAMPGFGRNHSPEDIWHYVLWVRHLAHFSPAEQQQIEQQVKAATSRHEMTMEHGMGAGAP